MRRHASDRPDGRRGASRVPCRRARRPPPRLFAQHTSGRRPGRRIIAAADGPRRCGWRLARTPVRGRPTRQRPHAQRGDAGRLPLRHVRGVPEIPEDSFRADPGSVPPRGRRSCGRWIPASRAPSSPRCTAPREAARPPSRRPSRSPASVSRGPRSPRPSPVGCGARVRQVNGHSMSRLDPPPTDVEDARRSPTPRCTGSQRRTWTSSSSSHVAHEGLPVSRTSAGWRHPAAGLLPDARLPRPTAATLGTSTCTSPGPGPVQLAARAHRARRRASLLQGAQEGAAGPAGVVDMFENFLSNKYTSS